MSTEPALEPFRRIAHTLSAQQLQVLQILDAAGPSSAEEVASAWPQERLAQSPSLGARLPKLLLRTLWQLERLGYLQNQASGRYQLTDAGAKRVRGLRSG